MLRFTSPILLMIALALVAITIAVALARKVQMRVSVRVLLACGLVLLAFAAGGPAAHLLRNPKIVVMVDASASTRGAAHRDVGGVLSRSHALLGSVPRRLLYFADRSVEADARPFVSETLSDKTVFQPPSADVVLLFSDGRFELPNWAPPTFAVIDPKLQTISDGRIASIEIRGTKVVVRVENSGDTRELSISAVAPPIPIRRGSQTVAFDIQSSDDPIRASLNPADLWPENDSLTIFPAPPLELQRWWVGGSAPSSAWIALDPSALPADSARYLNARVIVLDNVSADSLTKAQQDRLMQFVRDLGGGLVILGGDRAFAAGGYPGTALEILSPLSSNPPAPTTYWILLADSSGSMASVVGDSTRWQLAANALTEVAAGIPSNDPVSIGSFARELRWWSHGRSARETAALPLPPAGISPQGPTNLQPALESIVTSSNGAMPTEVLVISDADTKLDPAPLADLMKSMRVRFHLLATADAGSENPVRKLVEATGGTVLSQSDPKRWTQAARQLLRAASQNRLVVDPVQIRFVGPLETLGGATISFWNQVWPKEQITSLALARTSTGDQTVAAECNFGAGRVAAVAFAPNSEAIDGIIDLIARAPRDPRFKLTWTTARELRVQIDAVDGSRYLNGLTPGLEIRDAHDPSRLIAEHAMQQIAPGRYELSMPAPRNPVIASVLLDGAAVDRRAVAGRYAPEFDGTGIDRNALNELAAQTAGRVIEPSDRSRIDFKFPHRRFDLTSILATSGAILIAMGLIRWKLR